MGIRSKDRRKIVFDHRAYRWYVAPDCDGPYDTLHILSEDKRFILHCPLHPGLPYVMVRGTVFQGAEKRGVADRYRLPFPVPEVVTPRFVATLLEWALNDRGAVRVEWDGDEIPI
ncbi:MAG: hypothetical protein K2G93_04650 [Rikenella sp.]|nr:hypothetical protein [Rikenella sp.]